MESVTYFNQTNIEFLGHLGDLIQTNFSNFNVGIRSHLFCLKKHQFTVGIWSKTRHNFRSLYRRLFYKL